MFNIIEKLGGLEATLDVIERRTGKRPTRYAVQAWTSKRSISSTIIIPLMQECAARGLPFDVADCRDPRPLPPHRESFPRKSGQGHARP